MAKKEIPTWKRINKPFASLKLAVFVILALGTMSAWGTIVESKYNDARRAQELVYHSWYSYTIFLLLSVNLISVMADRWPWKKKHIGFICAHIGILTLISGSLLTRYWGVDGSMAIDIGKKNTQVMLPGYTDIVVYSGLASGGYRQVFNREVNFLKYPPTEEEPMVFDLPGAKIKIDKFQAYSLGQSKVNPSDSKTDGPGLRFQLANERVKETNWILTGGRPMEESSLGPAKVVLAKKGLYSYAGGNILLLEFDGENPVLDYSVYTQRLGKKTAGGKIKAGDVVETGWMGLTFRLLKYLPHASMNSEFMEVARGGDGVVSSIRVSFNGKSHWMALNSNMKFFTDSAVYYLGFVNRMIPLDFAIALKDFQVGRYQGTSRAASYASDVMVIEKGEKPVGPIHIAMNEPLHHKSFTFYQASFSQDETGKATTSVLSVNRDPGRPLKYIGCLMIVFGMIDLFYIRRKRSVMTGNKKTMKQVV